MLALKILEHFYVFMFYVLCFYDTVWSRFPSAKNNIMGKSVLFNITLNEEQSIIVIYNDCLLFTWRWCSLVVRMLDL